MSTALAVSYTHLSRHIRDRLFRELNTDVSLRVEENPGSENSFKVSGRGELHLSVLIENMQMCIRDRLFILFETP